VDSNRHPSAIVRIGPVEGNYKRTPALVAQVHHLNTSDSANLYFLADPRNADFQPITVRHPGIMSAFRKVRDVAAKTGDRSAVAAIGKQLLVATENGIDSKSAHPLRFSRSDVIAQLTREYGGPVEKDIRILEMIAEHTDGETQISRLAEGSSDKIYDVTSARNEREALAEYLRNHND
jgi:hypothetical protein